MGSGPTAGLAEIHLHDLQPGSSIMPGKVNPVIPEATLQVCAQVIGNDAAITFAGASGSFELNVMLPVIARNLLESIRLLTNASRLLADCVDGITADRERLRAYAESSPSIVTPLNQYARLRGGRQDRQAGTGRRRHHPADGARPGVRRARRDHRGAARRGARRGADDPALTGATTYVITGGSRRHRARVRQPDRDGPARTAGSCWSAATRPVPRPPSGASAPSRPQCRVDSLLCDFADQSAVRRLAEDLLRTCDRIDVLVNNAGTVFARRTLTADGIESTFAVNHLGGFLLTELLLDRIRESAPARLVFTSSAGHYSGTLDLDDLGFERGYSMMRAYARSKLANVLTARLLARRLDGQRRHRELAPPGRDLDQHLERRAVVRPTGAGRC